MAISLEDINNIQNFLVESLKYNNKQYTQVVNAKHPDPCGICQKNVNRNQKAILCDNCKHWIHIKCNGTTADEYKKIIDNNSLLSDEEIDNNVWYCNKCLLVNMADIFPFGLESDQELECLMNCDSLEILDKLPSYEIMSKACDIDTLNNYDLDENIISNINSRYYTVHEFKSLKNKNSFNIFHTNLNGLGNKIDTIHNFISSTKLDIDIINISETSQRENVDFITNVLLDGYRAPFTIGSRSARGGVALYVKSDLNVFERDDLNICDKSFQVVWVEVKVDKKKNIVCGCAYRHPNNNIDEFNVYISKCLERITKEKKECYFSGDFNIDLLKYESNNKYSEFLNTVTSHGFLPHILQPTRITDESSTIIDNIYGNNFEQDAISGNILVKFSDHFPQFLSINKENIKLKPNDVYLRDMSNFDEKLFIDDISIQNWNANRYTDTNSKFNDFLWRVENCVDRHAPIKKLNRKQMKKRSKPWITTRILKMINHRERLFHKKKDNPLSVQIKNVYNLFRNRINREIKKSKKGIL